MPNSKKKFDKTNIDGGVGINEDTDLIKAILDGDEDRFFKILHLNPISSCDVHSDSGMNAPMLSAFGRQAKFLKALLDVKEPSHFTWKDKMGRTLLDIAVLARSIEIEEIVFVAFRMHMDEGRQAPEP